MEGKCVACGEVAAGKPLYKKLGANNLQIEVYDALIEMELLSLPERAKTDCYICWDCDETVAEEYTNFVETEKKRKFDEKKRKEQDFVRNKKLNKKLTQAFKKAHKDSMVSKGDAPKVSKYRQKEDKKVANRHYASNCFLCKNPFRSSKIGYLRFNMKKMVDDHCTVYEVLQKLGHSLNLDSNLQMRRFICCQCYNKVRRNYKSSVHDKYSEDTNHVAHTNGSVQTSPVTAPKAVKRATFDEHAAEIAKLIPPGLADMYKVVGQESPQRYSSPSNPVNVLDDLSYTESDTDSSDDSVGAERKWSRKSPSAIRTFIPKNGTTSQKQTSPPSFVQSSVCAVCGLCYKYRPRSFWYSLSDKVPSVPQMAVSVFQAVHVLDIRLAAENKFRKHKDAVCKPCYSRICIGFKSKVVNKLSPKKGKSAPNGHQWNRIDSGQHYIPRPLSVKNRMANMTKPATRRCKNNSSSSDSLAVKKDMHLMAIINKSAHLRYKGKPVLLKSVNVNVLNVAEAMKGMTGPTVYTERLQDIHHYSNFMRSVKNKYDGKCILCLSDTMEKSSRWLEDPVCPPHLMVPLRWARLSLGPPDENTNLPQDDGKVCNNCYNYVKSEFMKFVNNKIGLSMDDGKISLKKYKVSFDSVAMSVVADPLLPMIDHRKRNSPTLTNKSTISPTKERSILKEPVQHVNENGLPTTNKYSQPTLLPNDRPDDFNRNECRLKNLTGINAEKDSSSEMSNSADCSDIASMSSSISTYSDEVINEKTTFNEPFKDAPNLESNSSSNITEFRGRSNRLLAKASRYDTTKSPTTKTGVKRKHDSSNLGITPDQKKPKLDGVQEVSIVQSTINHRKRLFEDDPFEEDYFQSSEDSVAPFAQRKKIRTKSTNINIGHGDAPSIGTESITKTFEDVWQTLQGISIDCLISSNELQPVKPENFTHGFLCSLNFIKDEIGACNNDVVQWLCKVFPTEFRNIGRKLCKEAVFRHLKDLYVEKEEVNMGIFNETLPLDFYTPLKEKGSNCYIENVLNTAHRFKEHVDWHYYLHPTNMDKLINGTLEPVSCQDFNSGLIYALWRANEFLNGKDDNLIKWMILASPEHIPNHCYKILIQNAKRSHRFISDNPSILINLNVPIIVSSEELQQIVFIDKTSIICHISRKPTTVSVKEDVPPVNGGDEKLAVSVSTNKINKTFSIGIASKSTKDKQKCELIPPSQICEQIPRGRFSPSPILSEFMRQKNLESFFKPCGKASRESSNALVRVNPKDRAITLASTSKGAPIVVGGCMQLLPMVQPNGIVTFVPFQMPTTSIVPSPTRQIDPLSMSDSQIAPISFPIDTNVLASGSMPITISNNNQLKRRVEELERKLNKVECQMTNSTEINLQMDSEKKD